MRPAAVACDAGRPGCLPTTAVLESTGTSSSSSMGHRRAREHFRIWCSTVPGVPAAFAHAEVENTVALENCTIKYIHFYSHLPLNVSIFDKPRNLLILL